MARNTAILLLLAAIAFAFGSGCKKESETVFTGNEIPPYSEIPTLLVENYVNRLFIDIIGREPTDGEMSAEVAALEGADLSAQARTNLVVKLMSSTLPAGGGESYQSAYFRKLYEDQKARFLDGTGEGAVIDEYNQWRSIAILDSLNGDMLSYQIIMIEANKVEDLLDSREDLQNGLITIDEMCRRMMFNSVYDNINMNTFNFINASFDDCFFRFPTEAELNAAFDPIEFNGAGSLFNEAIANKADYLRIMTTSDEFSEGMVRWCYRSLLSREASTIEVVNLLDEFNNGYNTSLVQQSILITDEFAGFNP